MQLQEYFKIHKGVGVLFTSDKEGNMETQVYPMRPHVMDDGTMALPVQDMQCLKNLYTNPRAIFVYLQRDSAFQGKRLYLRKIRMDKEVEVSYPMRGKRVGEKDLSKKYHVYFAIDKEAPLLEIPS